MKYFDWLYSLESKGIVLGLERVKELLVKLGNPQEKLKCIHVTGTNGKGSVCAMTAAILQEQGYKAGLYTSPHLKRFNERIQINGVEISDKELERLSEKVKSNYTNQTFFEATTAIAFLYFYEQKVDFAVLEVGMGGRLDATNTVVPLVSVITNVSLEHTKLLGETEEKIAYEKAGIIKWGIPVITLAKGGALEVIKKIAREKGCKLIIPKIDRSIKTGLIGDFQYENAAIALSIINIMRERGYKIGEEAVKNGLEKVRWPGRLEFVEKNVLVDCGHNPSGILALKKEIEKIRKKYGKIISVVGILKDKDKKTMLGHISSFSDYILFCMPKTERATKPEELASLVSIPNEVVYDCRNALKKAKKLANPDDLIVVAGSIYVVGEVI